MGGSVNLMLLNFLFMSLLQCPKPCFLGLICIYVNMTCMQKCYKFLTVLLIIRYMLNTKVILKMLSRYITCYVTNSYKK